MIIRAVIIDNRQYERRLEKDKHHSMMLKKKLKRKDHCQPYYKPQSMKINVTQRKLYQTSDKKPQNKVQREKGCYTCEKMRHFSKEYTQNKYKSKLSSYNKNDRFTAATKIVKTDDHNRLS